jgi:hypothetical protein
MPRFLVVALLLSGPTLLVSGCQLESEQSRMVRLVKGSLQKEGIQAGVEPVVELTKKGEDFWIGTATYRETIYDLRVSKDASGDLLLERQMREATPRP